MDREQAQVLASSSRQLILESLGELRDSGHQIKDRDGVWRAAGRSAKELAETLGLHPTTMRFHLEQLSEAGLVTAYTEVPGRGGRPRKLYALAPSSVTDPSSHPEHLLAEVLIAAWDPQAPRRTPQEAGAQWGRSHVVGGDLRPARTAGEFLGKIGTVADALREWGYDPEVSTADGGRTATVTLSHCPFRELARTNQSVVCGLHEGIVTGSLEALGEHDVELSLSPLIDGQRCVAKICARQRFGSPQVSTAKEGPAHD